MDDRAECKGALFSRTYVYGGPPAQDKSSVRKRLSSFYEYQINSRVDFLEIDVMMYIEVEGGKYISETAKDIREYIIRCYVNDLLDFITLLWKYLKSIHMNRVADLWAEFVERVFAEERMGYLLDDQCGVHIFVDQEFERNRVSALACLSDARYTGIRDSFERSFGYLDNRVPDTKASVRSAFEALESMARLVSNSRTNLSRKMVKETLKPLLLASAIHDIEANAISEAADGLAEIVNSIHNYRHGAASETPVAPSLAYAVFVLSSVASFLRLLAENDAARHP